MLNDLKSKLSQFWVSHKLLAIIFLASATLTIIFHSSNTAQSKNESRDDVSPDTFIPKGYVLVPIEIANFEKVNSIIGTFGVVDLYLVSEDGKRRTKKVASALRILRAPGDPNEFAVLVPEDKSGELIGYESAFYVTIQNPKKSDTRFAKHRHHKSRITLE